MTQRHWWAAAAAGIALAVGGCSTDPADEAAPTESATAAEPVSQGVKVGRAPGEPFTVAATDLGIHSYTTQPEVPTKSIRLTCSPNWATVNTAPGQIRLDRRSTPKWRGPNPGASPTSCTPSAPPPSGPEPRRAGNDRPPSARERRNRPRTWRSGAEWVSAVAKRYKGRITGYEIWNEPSSPQFYAGTPAADGEDDRGRLRSDQGSRPRRLRACRPAPRPTTRTCTTVLPGLPEASRNWDGPWTGCRCTSTPRATAPRRHASSRSTWCSEELDKVGTPEDLPLWDTEVNYNVGLPGGESEGRITVNGPPRGRR